MREFQMLYDNLQSILASGTADLTASVLLTRCGCDDMLDMAAKRQNSESTY